MGEKQLKEIGLNQGRNAKIIREEIRNESQNEVAKRANTYQQKISRMENKRKLSEHEKIVVSGALGVDIEDIEYLDRDRVLIKIFKENQTTANENSELNFGGEYYKIVNPLPKVSELYERLSKVEQYVMYLETICEAKGIEFKEKKKEIYNRD